MGSPRALEIAGLVAGFVVWSAAFVLLYSLHGLGCADPGFGGGTRWALVVGWGAMLAGHGLLAAWLWRRWRRAEEELRFVRLVSLVLALAAGAATVWIGLPVAVLGVC